MAKRTHSKRFEKKDREMKRGLEETKAYVQKVEKAKAAYRAWCRANPWVEE